MEVVSLQLSAFLYLLSAGGYITNVWRPSEWARRGGPLLLAFAFALHTLFVALHLQAVGTLPATTFAGGLGFFTWMLIAAYLLVQLRYDLTIVGAIVTPLAFVLTFAAIAFHGGDTVAGDLAGSPWLHVHITFAFLGDAVFGLAFAVSVVYLVQESFLKSRSHGSLIRRLPALEKLDRLNYLLLVWGFPCLTLGMITGAVSAANNKAGFLSWEPLEIVSVLAWFLYAGLVQFRITGGLRGRRAAHLTILGFGVLIVSYLAVNMLPLPGRHGGGIVS